MIVSSIIFAILIIFFLIGSLLIHKFFLNVYLHYTSVKFVVSTGIFLAICLVFRVIDDQVFTANQTLEWFATEPLVLFLSGLFLGPFAASIIGVFSDLLGSLTGIKGFFFIGFSFTNLLTGFFGGLAILLFLLFKKHLNKKSFVIANAICLNVVFVALVITEILIFFPFASKLPPKSFINLFGTGVKIALLLITTAFWIATNWLTFYQYRKYHHGFIILLILMLLLRYLIVSFVIDIQVIHFLYNINRLVLFYERLVSVPIAFSVIAFVLVPIVITAKRFSQSCLLYVLDTDEAL